MQTKKPEISVDIKKNNTDKSPKSKDEKKSNSKLSNLSDKQAKNLNLELSGEGSLNLS